MLAWMATERKQGLHFILQTLTSPISKSLEDKSENLYPFSSLWINGRQVSFEKIREQKEEARSPFEENTFNFIRWWLSGEETFHISTSGSTGNPKVISLSRMQMVVSAQQTARNIGLQKFSRALVCIDTKYIGGKMMLVRCLTTGLSIMALDPSANPLIKIPVDKCVQFTALVPYQINVVLESKHPHLLNNLDKILIGGAPLGSGNREQLDRYQCECYETYGMTETVSHIALRLVNTKMKRQYFETLPGVEISKDNRGCLVISADYLQKPVITNDLVDIPERGKFLWLGRWDTMINTGGVKVVPEKLEKKLETIFHQVNFHNRFFIAALPDDRLGNKIVLVIEGVQFSSELLGQSLTALKSVVSPFEFPKAVYTVPKFAFTETQKIDRNQTLPGVTFHSSLK